MKPGVRNEITFSRVFPTRRRGRWRVAGDSSTADGAATRLNVARKLGERREDSVKRALQAEIY